MEIYTDNDGEQYILIGNKSCFVSYDFFGAYFMCDAQIIRIYKNTDDRYYIISFGEKVFLDGFTYRTNVRHTLQLR